MKRLIFALLFASTSAYAFGPYPAELVRVIDGDTVKVRAEIWPGLFKEINVRIVGIDAPESRNGKKNGLKIPTCEIALGKKAKLFTEQFLTGPLVLYDVSLGKFARRVLGQLKTERGDLSIALVVNRHARAYNGGKRTIWPCSIVNNDLSAHFSSKTLRTQ